VQVLKLVTGHPETQSGSTIKSLSLKLGVNIVAAVLAVLQEVSRAQVAGSA
jgi:hypothetical protein